MGLADSRPHARQLVLHGHFDVNGVPTNISSYGVRPGDEITVHGASRKLPVLPRNPRLHGRPSRPPEWLRLVDVTQDGVVDRRMIRVPERAEIRTATQRAVDR